VASILAAHSGSSGICGVSRSVLVT
jgi:hypothetical protein